MKNTHLRYCGVALIACALFLHLIRQVTAVGSGFDVEDFLGWIDPGSVGEMTSLWNTSGAGDLAANVYLAIDMLVFVPLYSLVLLELGRRLFEAIADDWTTAPVQCFMVALGGLVLALIGVDQIENVIGFWRIHPDSRGLPLIAGLAGTAIALRLLHRFGLIRAHWTTAWTIYVLLVVGAVLFRCAGPYCEEPLKWLGPHCSEPLAWRIGSFTHKWKKYLTLIVLAVLLLSAAAWYFSLALHSGNSRGQALARLRRARLRSECLDIVMRSRYVLISLLMLYLAALAMPQGRDILSATFSIKYLGGGAVVGSAVVLATFVFGHACWLWTRAACAIASAGSKRHASDSSADFVARDWARILGSMPGIMLILLCGQTIRDLAMAGQFGDTGAITALIAVAGIVLIFTMVVIWLRQNAHDPNGHYYARSTLRNWWKKPADTGPKPETHSKFAFFWVITPFWLPILAGTLMWLTRAVDVAGWSHSDGSDLLPSLAIATLLLALTFWVSLFGWLSLYEENSGNPWVAILIVIAALLQTFDQTENHVVWQSLAGAGDAASTLHMLLFSGGLLLFCFAMYALLLPEGLNPDWTFGQRLRYCASLVLPLAALLLLADQHAGDRRPIQVASQIPPPGTKVEQALDDWLKQLWLHRTELVDPDSGQLRVYFVAADGGGIRAGHWAALMLARMHAADPNFSRRTFAISSVSGGSVGAAVYRACVGQTDGEVIGCVEKFGAADLMSPVLGAWMFEDILARVIPTSLCTTPGCGFLSRAAWFEDALENVQAGPLMRTGLVASRQALLNADRPHVPYLMLNSTWVETGERAIASELVIDSQTFPAARDQLALLNDDLPLATAAHNSARFPYVNPLGAVMATPGRCADRDAYLQRTTAVRRMVADVGDAEVCGHLADGGYVDNSGATTTINLLNALARRLDGDTTQHSHLKWLREHLQPQVIYLRNGVTYASDEHGRCVDLKHPTASQIAPREPPAFQPYRPRCAGKLGTFANSLGVVVAAANTLGVAEGSIVAAAGLEFAVGRVRATLVGKQPESGVVAIDLVEDGVRYPLGWHLSPAARKGMLEQSTKACDKLQGVVTASRLQVSELNCMVPCSKTIPFSATIN